MPETSGTLPSAPQAAPAAPPTASSHCPNAMPIAAETATAETIYEALEDAGLTTAAINITTYRGRHRHLPTIPGAPAVNGPKRFFFYSLYESDRTGAPIGLLNRALGSIDAYAATVGRWLVTRDGFDLLVFYLPDYDFASHARTRRSPRSSRPRAVRTSSSTATPSSSVPTTDRRTSSRRRGCTFPERS